MTETPFLTLYLDDDSATLRLGEDLAPMLRDGDCLLLIGDLGAGKTTLARALIRSFLGDEEAEVPSPTFTLVNPHDAGRLPLHHFDLYRLNDPDELVEIGFQEALDQGITLIEWPDRALAEMPDDSLTITFDIEVTGRRAAFSGSRRWRERVERTLAIRTFLNDNAWTNAERRFLQGDASPRAYEKVVGPSGQQAVLMDSPAMADGPVVKDGKRYSELAHLAEDVRPFVAIGEALRERGFPAPELFAHDLGRGFLLMEDFGQETVIDDGAPSEERYEVAVDILARMHGMDWPDTVSLPDGSRYTLPHFDWGVVDIEISLLADWYAPRVLGKTIPDDAQARYREIWRQLFEIISSGEQSWFLRDYHSPNLIWRAGEHGKARIGLIDYQDALIGPSAYDVASLCQDARYTVPADMEFRLKKRYVAARERQERPFDGAGFERDYAIIAAERGTRLLGLWPRLKYRDGKPHYMAHMPRTKDYLKRALEHPSLIDLKHWYRDNLEL